MKLTLKPMLSAFLIVFSVSGVTYSNAAHADDSSDTQKRMQLLEQQVELLTRELGKLKQKEEAQEKPEAKSQAASAAGGILKNIQFYGNLDLSIDDTTKGIGGMTSGGTPSSPVGRVGWMPAVSTNLSYLGLRGKHDLGNGLSAMFQLETQLDISATAGTANTNSNSDSAVKGALTSRNSFIGLSSTSWGAVKAGKTDAPYKTSTARMNPFSGMLGDYSVVMGNTGGDNRVEFGNRLDHAVWYESPNLNGFTVNVLVAPGQNRAYDNTLQAAGETDCAGGNVPGSGGTPYGCNDGAYGSAYSGNVAYTAGPLYATVAYEIHKGVNRSSDLAPIDAAGNLDPNDIVDESATKIGIQYTIPTTKTVLSAIYEDMRRKVPDYLQSQNERNRSGYWLAVTQPLNSTDSISFGWAHANKAQGDPGTHNTPGGSDSDNAANMYTVAFKSMIDLQTAWYVDYAVTANHAAAHYDLGAGGRGVTTDCHDGSQIATSSTPGGNGGPFCWAGGRLQGFSVGMNYKF